MVEEVDENNSINEKVVLTDKNQNGNEMKGENENDEKLSFDVFIPGRLCILGEHTDWIGGYRKVNRRVGCGYTIVCTTAEGLYARCNTFKPEKFRYSFKNNTSNDDIDKSEGNTNGNASSEIDSKIMEFACDLNIEQLKLTAQNGGFFCYVAGTLAICLERYTSASGSGSNSTGSTPMLMATGLEIVNYKTTLPMKKGLSSSASVCVLVCTCFNNMFNTGSNPGSSSSSSSSSAPWTRDQIMDIAYRGECITGSKCGRMDQCVAMGQGVIGLMQFTSLRRDMDLDTTNSQDCDTLPSIQQVYNKSELHFVVGNVMGSKDTVAILQALNACFPYAQNSRQVR